ncbi:MAG: hypothetical protein WD874_00965 [Parcubacteria group bacterium]
MTRKFLILASLSLVLILTPEVAHALSWPSLENWLLIPMAKFMIGIAALFTQLGGVLLNSVIIYTVVDMAKHYKELPEITTAWTAVRDIANMGFIFVLLYAAIQTILGVGKGTKQLIVNIVIAAILINFSLFFTQLVIDAGNVIAIAFYDIIAPNAAGADGNLRVMTRGLSNAYTTALSLPSLWETTNISMGNIIAIGVMGPMILLIAAFNFFAVAFLLIIRYAVLILLLILSPIVFVSGVLPGMGKYKSQWVSALFGQSFFPAVYFLLTWISLVILGGLKRAVNGDNSNWPNTLGAGGGGGSYSPDSIGLLLMFGVAIVFMVASVVIAKQVADKAGGGIGKLTSGAMSRAGAMSFGMAGRMGRGTLGRFGAGMASSETVKNMIDKGGITGRAGRLALAAGNKSSKSSWDMRSTGLSKTLGAGKAPKGGFNKDKENRDARAAEIAKALQPREEVRTGLAENENETKRTYDEAVQRAGKDSSGRINRTPQVIAAEREYQKALMKNRRVSERSEKFAEREKTDIFGTEGMGGAISNKLKDVSQNMQDKAEQADAYADNAHADLSSSTSTPEEREEAKNRLEASDKEARRLRKAASFLSSVGRVAGLRRDERKERGEKAKNWEKTLREKKGKEMSEQLKKIIEKEKEISEKLDEGAEKEEKEEKPKTEGGA